MKRTFKTTLMALFLCVLMVFSLTACGGFTQDDIDNAVNEATAPLNEQITTLEADIAEKEIKIATLETEKAALISEKEALEAEIAALETSNGTLTAEKAALNARVNELEASISAKDAEIAELEAEKKTLTDRVAELEDENKKLEDEKSELEKENEALKNCLAGNHDYTYTDNGDGTHSPVCQYCDYENAAETEDHNYNDDGECECGAEIPLVSTLEELEAAIENGGEYMLGDNIQVPEYLAINTEFILHLNGKKLIGAVEGDVVLWGSSTSNVTILGDGVLTNSEDAIIEDAIINGTIINDRIIDLSGIANIAGGTFLGQVSANYGTCKISGGQIHYMEVSGATCTVNDGKIDLLLVSSTCTVNGGEIKTLRVPPSEGCVTITGGWVENLLVDENTGDTCIITGGTFGVDPTAYVDTENYTVTDNGDGTWTVTAK